MGHGIQCEEEIRQWLNLLVVASSDSGLYLGTDHCCSVCKMACVVQLMFLDDWPTAP